jgi:hypothetical protein
LLGSRESSLRAAVIAVPPCEKTGEISGEELTQRHSGTEARRHGGSRVARKPRVFLCELCLSADRQA